MVSLRAPGVKTGRGVEPATLSVRLGTNITLDVRSDGAIAACFYGQSVNLGKFSVVAVERAQKLRLGCQSIHSHQAIVLWTRKFKSWPNDWPSTAY